MNASQNPNARNNHGSGHLSDTALQRIIQGKVSSQAAEAVKAHLRQCKFCRRRLEEAMSDMSVALSLQSNDPSVRSQDASDTVAGPPKSGSQQLNEQRPSQDMQQSVEIPEQLNNHPIYQVKRLIGEGAMGAVFLVQHRLTERFEALKIIHPSILNRPDSRERFRAEIVNAAKLLHPNVVQTMSALSEGDLLGLVMEYAPGLTLAEMVKEKGALTLGTSLRILRQVASGLQHAHDKEMVHRDIKPSNLIACEGPDLQIKILDFGLAKSKSDLEITERGVVGTPNYMSPEQSLSPTQADIKSDIYSLGCVFFFLLTGRSPYQGGSHLEVLQQHASAPIPRLDSFRKDCLPVHQSLLERMMAKNPSKRFFTPANLIREIDRIVSGEARANRPMNPESLEAIAPTKNSRRKRSLAPTMIGWTAALSLMITILYLFPPRQWNLSRLFESGRPTSFTLATKTLSRGVEVRIDGSRAEWEHNPFDSNTLMVQVTPGPHEMTFFYRGKEVHSLSTVAVEKAQTLLNVVFGDLDALADVADAADTGLGSNPDSSSNAATQPPTDTPPTDTPKIRKGKKKPLDSTSPAAHQSTASDSDKPSSDSMPVTIPVDRMSQSEFDSNVAQLIQAMKRNDRESVMRIRLEMESAEFEGNQQRLWDDWSELESIWTRFDMAMQQGVERLKSGDVVVLIKPKGIFDAAKNMAYDAVCQVFRDSDDQAEKRISFIAKNGNQLRFRVDGENRSYQIDELPSSLQQSLLRMSVGLEDPTFPIHWFYCVLLDTKSSPEELEASWAVIDAAEQANIVKPGFRAKLERTVNYQ